MSDEAPAACWHAALYAMLVNFFHNQGGVAVGDGEEDEVRGQAVRVDVDAGNLSQALS